MIDRTRIPQVLLDLAGPASDGALQAVLFVADQLAVSADPHAVFDQMSTCCVPILATTCSYRPAAAGEFDVMGEVGGRALVTELPGSSAQEVHYAVQFQDDPAGAGEAGPVAGTLTFGYQSPAQARQHAPAVRLLVAWVSSQLHAERQAARSNALAERLRNVEIALATNREIGVALGIVMERHKLSSDGAFELLARISQQSHRKVREVAADIVQTGLIELPPERAARPRPTPPARPRAVMSSPS